jgi:hypothetical protein
MSHPDSLFDPDNSYKDDDMFFTEPNDSDIPFIEYLYDDHNDFFDEDSSNYHPDAEHEISTHVDHDENEEDDIWKNLTYIPDDSMDGDHDSAMESAGWGTDEDYGYYGEDY